MSETEKDQQEAHREAIADSLRPVLDEGDSFNVYCQDGEVFVTDAETSVIAARYPRVYGRLLALEAQLESAGTALSRYPFLALAIFCVGLNLDWWNDWLGALVGKLNSFLFYLIAFVALHQLLTPIKNLLDRSIYRRHHEDLFALLGEERIDRDSLLAMIESDGALSRIAYQLKLDPDAARRKE